MNEKFTFTETSVERQMSYIPYFLGVTLLFLFFLVSGIHTSSLGMLAGERIQDSPTYYGKPQPIRSDEYLRSSPIWIGSIKTRENPKSLEKKTTTTPFDSSYPDDLLSGDVKNSQNTKFSLGSVYNGITNFDDRLVSLLPLENEFAARWWLNTFYMFFGIGLLFRALKLSWKFSLLCSLLIWLSPSNQWWSLWPVQSIGPAAMAVGFFLHAVFFINEKKIEEAMTSRSLLLNVIGPLFLSVIFAVRLPGTYQPWSVPTAIFFACLTVGVLFQARISMATSRKILIPFFAIAGVCAFPLLYRLNNLVSKMASTAYPGSRRFTGHYDYPHWSGAASWAYQNVSGTEVNQSELAIGMILFVPIAVLVILFRANNSRARNSLRFPLLLGCGSLSFFLLWVIAPWTKGASDFFLMSRFPPERIMQILGVLAPIVFVLSIAFWREKSHEKETDTKYLLVIGLIVFVATLQGTVSLRLKFLGNLTLGAIWITALVATLAIMFAFSQRFWRVGLCLLLAASVFSVSNVNPIGRGLGIFGNSAAMSALQSASSLDQGRWASDNYVFDSIPTGGGMRLLSGSQGSGPNLTAYHLLDPDEKSIEIWNRAGSYVFFNWTSGPAIGFVNPSLDVVAIQIDPCNSILNQFDLGWVVSSNDLASHTCLRYYTNIVFQGTRYIVYKRSSGEI